MPANNSSAGSNPPAGGSSAVETTSNPPAGASGSQGQNNQISDPQGSAQHSQAEEEHISPDVARELKREAKALRDRNKALEEAAKVAADAQLSEQERLQKAHSDLQERYAALESERQNWRLADAIARHAPTLNLIDPDTARVLLLTGGELETDSDGNYTNVEKLLEKLVAAKPYLIANGQTPRPFVPTSGGATNPARSGAPIVPQQKPVDTKELYQRHKQSGGLANPNLWKKNP